MEYIKTLKNIQPIATLRLIFSFAMKKNDNNGMMTGLDWFALCTSAIGLVADFVTIASLANSGNTHQTFPLAIWVVVPPLIMYTTILISFYTRRIGLVNHLKTKTSLSSEDLNKIDTGGYVAAQIVGTPLLLLYLVCCIISFANKSVLLVVIITATVSFGIPGAIFISNLLNRLADAMYKAFDPRYVATSQTRNIQDSEQSTELSAGR